MKVLLKSLLIVLFLFGLRISFFLAQNYHADLPVSTVIERYAYEQSTFIEVDDYQVHYRKMGQGVPLLLVHGFSANLRN